MDIATINHATQALSRLVSQYADKPKLRALLTGIGGVANNIETALAAIGEALDPTVALGEQLEICGFLVGVSKVLPNGDALTDGQFRVLVLAQIARNHCKGTVPDMRAALRFIFDSSNAGVDMQVDDLGGMAMHAQLGRLLTSDERSVLDITSGDSQTPGGILPKPSGVTLTLSERAATDFFCFSDISAPGVPLLTGGIGFSDIGSPTGSWAGAIT